MWTDIVKNFNDLTYGNRVTSLSIDSRICIWIYGRLNEWPLISRILEKWKGAWLPIHVSRGGTIIREINHHPSFKVLNEMLSFWCRQLSECLKSYKLCFSILFMFTINCYFDLNIKGKIMGIKWVSIITIIWAARDKYSYILHRINNIVFFGLFWCLSGISRCDNSRQTEIICSHQ